MAFVTRWPSPSYEYVADPFELLVTLVCRFWPSYCTVYGLTNLWFPLNHTRIAYHSHTPSEGFSSFAKPLARVFTGAIFQPMQCLGLVQRAERLAIRAGLKWDGVGYFRVARRPRAAPTSLIRT
jgi:hypothetical protein